MYWCLLHFDSDRRCSTVGGWRTLIASHLQTHRLEYSDFFSDRPGDAFEDHLNGISGSAYGDNLTLRVACDVLKRPIVVWHKDSDQAPVVIVTDDISDADLKRPLCIELDEPAHGPPHHEALVLAAGGVVRVCHLVL